MLKKLLAEDKLDLLVSRLEESIRATKGSTTKFIEPAAGTLSKAENNRNHIIFGRRGAGKSSLLNKVSTQLSVKRIPNAFIDLESFKGHSYPDVLMSVLIDVFNEFHTWLKSVGLNPSNKTSWWIKIFGRKPTKPPLKKKDVDSLLTTIEACITELRVQLFSADDLEIKDTCTNSAATETSAELGAAIGSSNGNITAKIADNSKSAIVTTREAAYKHKKVQFLTQHILDYQKVFSRIRLISGCDAFLLLDDLYHIRKEDQHLVLDFFHRMSKQNGLVLKVGTIRHRSQWYLHGNPPLGLKLGDDADEINLDLSLERFSTAKTFLKSILNQVVQDATGHNVDELITEGCIERLVLASGGVARDFLGIFKNAVEIKRNKVGKKEQLRVGVEDINEASGDYDVNKREELKRDTFEDRAILEQLFQRICEFCIDRNKSNILLLPKDHHSLDSRKIQELVDLRLIHFIDSRVTLRKYPGKLFEAYMLDISQYSGARKRKGFKIVEFWKPAGNAAIRAEKLLFTTSSTTVFPTV